MNIMIDYNGTYGAAPMMWREIIRIMQNYDNNLYLVTSRGEDTPVELEKDFEGFGIPIIYCNYHAKKDVCEKQGIRIDIWIDDDPYYIVNGFLPHQAFHTP